MAQFPYNSSVFINCPFDAEYQDIFDAIIFTVIDCGFGPRCALEVDDASEIRIDKIYRIVESSRFGIHDLSRTELDAGSGLPRFNMPLELGIFLAAKRYGSGTQKQKSCLILDLTQYRYQSFISDIAGQDIHGHERDPRQVVRIIRNWLASKSKRKSLPSGSIIWNRYVRFQTDLPAVCATLELLPMELTYLDRLNVIHEWLTQVT